jgi:hypothetical protein
VILRSVLPEARQSVRPGRVAALMEFGFTERQARFLAHVLVFSGVFLERQYRAFTGLVHGRKTQEFLAGLVDRGYATAITPGALHRGRLYHVQFKPLYEAIGEANNRHRKPASLGRFVERLMLLDAVLADHRYGWLGTEQDKRTYFREALEYPLPDAWYPHLTFHSSTDKTIRFFPEKMPIGVPLKGERRHVFLYLATHEVPLDFRVFLLRHADLLKCINEWTIRVLMPRRLRRAAALYRYAVRDAFLMPLELREVRELDWYFRFRGGELVCPSADRDLTVATAAQKYTAARFEALYRLWLQRGDEALRAMQLPLLRDDIQRGWGRFEFVQLPQQYLQLTALVGTSSTVENSHQQADNLATA